MQPDLPDPVVPGDEEVRHAGEVGPDRVAGDVLAEPDRQRARRRRQVAEDVAERDELRREVRDLDADGLLAGDRREDPDLRGRERVGEIVLQAGDLRHLRPGCELELVPGHARARDLARDGRLHAELRQRAHEEIGGLRARVAVRRRPGRRRTEQRSVGKPVLGVLGRRLEDRLDALELRLGLVDEQRRILGVRRGADDVGVRLGTVEQTMFRRVVAGAMRSRDVNVLLRLRLARGPLERTARARSGALHDVTRATENRARRGACHEKETAEEHGAADDRGARLADQRGERAADRHPDEAAGVLAEQRHEPEEAHPHPEPERTDVEQVASREQQAAKAEECDRQDVGSVSDDLREHVGEPRADGAAVEPEIEDGREDETECEQREAEELVLVLRARASRPLLHARRDAWTKRPLLPPSSHARPIRRATRGSSGCRAARTRQLGGSRDGRDDRHRLGRLP